MNIENEHPGFRQSLIALAILAVCAAAHADDSDISQLTQPQSSVGIGVWNSSGALRERGFFGQYNGMRDHRTSAQLEVDINKRDEATGTSMTLRGRNLGLDDRDLSFTHEQQGAWKYSIDYSGLVRHEVRTLNTGMLGAGTTTPTVVRLAAPGTGTDLNFQLKRVGLGLAGGMWINPRLQLEVNFKTEDKDGARAFTRGYACAAYVCTGAQTATNQTWAILMAAEPINSTTRQIEAKLNYSHPDFNLNAGYYGSFYSNANGSIRSTVPAALNNPLGVAATLAPAAGAGVIAGGGTSLQNVLQLPIALPPDNQAHQIYVSGNYRISPTTNGTFKYAYTHATQDDNFANAGLTNPPPGVTSLHGVVNSSLLQLGLNARPVPKLSLLANLRYEKVNDKTPEELYNVEAGTSVPATVPPNTNRFWNNLHINSTKVVGKLEAGYQLPADLRATAGLDFNSYKRPVPVSITEEELAGLGAVRASNRETGYRLELRRTMSETLSGAFSYGHSKRTGGDWTSLSTSAAFAAAGLGYGQTGSASQFIALNAGNAFPMNMADIDRQKIKLSANWSPTELIDVQFSADDNRDKNATAFSEVAQGKGWRETGLKSYSVDTSFAVSDNWKLTGYASQSHQNLKINHSTGYQADLNTRSDGFGFGVSGNPTSKLEVGAQLTYLQDNTKYGLAAAPSSAAGAPPTATNLAQAALGLPDVRYHMTRLNLTGTYSLDKTASVRVSLIHQRTKLDEWSYGNNGVPYLFSDNTTVTLNPRQTVNVLGVMYIFKF